MGNVCGCVRADKEEQFLDPAKAPLSPAKQSPGRKYFRRKSRKKQSEEEKKPEDIDENEGNIQIKTEHSKKSATHLKEKELCESVIQKAAVDRSDLLVRTKVTGDLVKTKLLNDIHCDSYTGNGACTYSRRASKAEEGERWLPKETERGPKTERPAQEKEYSNDGILGELIFQKNRKFLHFKTESNSNSVLKEQCEENALNINNAGDNPGQENNYLQPFEFKTENDPQQVFPKFGIVPFSVENAICSVLPNSKISDIHVTGESEDMSAKERLLLWTQQTTEGYAGIRCENFTTCWRDGRLFNAIIHKY
ncbi:Dystonin, partial [Varanus komodoensis]